MKRIKKFFFGVGCLLSLFGCADSKQSNVSEKQKKMVFPKIIFDTDMGPDYDDVGAIAVLHALADSAECEILATLSSDRNPAITPTIELFNRYFNRPNLPIGISGNMSPDFIALNNWNDTLLYRYAPDLLQKKYPSAVSVYRKVLSAQPDSSVTIVTVGFLSNISDLLDSEADEYSNQTGIDLVRSKVVKWVAMAGTFPQGEEFNIKKDVPAARNAIQKWPTPILFSGFDIGSKIRTGEKVATRQSDDPVTKAYAYNLKTYTKEVENGRQSWDQTAVLAAIRNPVDYFYVNGPGKFIVKEDGYNSWDPEYNAQHYFLTHKYTYQYIANVLEKLMLHEPK